MFFEELVLLILYCGVDYLQDSAHFQRDDFKKHTNKLNTNNSINNNNILTLAQLSVMFISFAVDSA